MRQAFKNRIRHFLFAESYSLVLPSFCWIILMQKYVVHFWYNCLNLDSGILSNGNTSTKIQRGYWTFSFPTSIATVPSYNFKPQIIDFWTFSLNSYLITSAKVHEHSLYQVLNSWKQVHQIKHPLLYKGYNSSVLLWWWTFRV